MQIQVLTSKKLEKLQAALLLDVQYYEFQTNESGIIVELKGKRAIKPFVKRFSEWFEADIFLELGDRYFNGGSYEERWKAWRSDKRFQHTYFDEFYKVSMGRNWQDLLVALEEAEAEGIWELTTIDIEELYKVFYEIVEVRLNLIQEHFEENIHENYILLHLSSDMKKETDHLPF